MSDWNMAIRELFRREKANEGKCPCDVPNQAFYSYCPIHGERGLKSAER